MSYEEQVKATNTVRKFDCDWDDFENELEIPCGNRGCPNSVIIEDDIHRGEVKYIGKHRYDSGQFIAVLSCECQAPVCDECACNDSPDSCRICGCDFIAVESVSKLDIMDARNFYKRWDHSNIQFFVMMHKDCQNFINCNLDRNYPFFLNWFLANRGVINITEMNSTEMCVHVMQFRMFCLKMNFLRSTAAVMKQIAPRMRIYNSQFEKFMRHSAGFIGSLRIIIFRKKDLERYRLFGLMMKMIAKIIRNSVVLMGGRESQVFATCFRRFYARLLLTKL